VTDPAEAPAAWPPSRPASPPARQGDAAAAQEGQAGSTAWARPPAGSTAPR
jgi:hypothetical protein